MVDLAPKSGLHSLGCIFEFKPANLSAFLEMVANKSPYGF